VTDAGSSRAATAIEVTTGGRFVYAPDEPCVVWTEAERAKGQAWGVKTVESFHTYGTPVVP
jgi:catechol 2,3-dioxygenase